MHISIRRRLVLTAVLVIVPPAFAAAAEDVGIELPAVPAAVMGGARFVKVAATTEGASGTDRVLELGPKTVTLGEAVTSPTTPDAEYRPLAFPSARLRG